MVFTYRAAEFDALGRRNRKLGFRGHLVAGGHFAAFNAEALLRGVPVFDSVAIGEGRPKPPQCDTKATPKPVDSQGIATLKPP